MPSEVELTAAADSAWSAQPRLPAILAGSETDRLVKAGMAHWSDVMPRRQHAVLRVLLEGVEDAASGDAIVAGALFSAVLGSVEMAGLLSRWDPRYLKPYEAVANHRYNVTTLSAEPNVWGAPQSGRGTVDRRLVHLAKAGNWYVERLGRTPRVSGPLPVSNRRSRGLASDDVRVVVGSSVKLLASDSSVDLVCTDPPYHDDVKYGELSEIFRAWAGLDTSRLAGEAVVGAHEADSASYEEILKGAFEEVRRVLRPDGHLVLSYANRDHAAWVALFGSLQDAGFEAIGYQVVQSENEVDHAKANRRACNLDVLLDLVVNDGRGGRRYSPAAAPGTSEESFCHMVGKRALSVGRLTGRWRESLTDAIKAHPFVGAPRKAHV